MLTTLVVGTVLLGFGAFAFPRRAEAAVKWYGVAVALAGMILLEIVTPPWIGSVDERARWLSYPFTANYHLGLDGISYARGDRALSSDGYYSSRGRCSGCSWRKTSCSSRSCGTRC
jgi:hypothetical protein